MQKSTKWIIGVLVFIVLSVVAAGLGVMALLLPVRVETDSGQVDPIPVTETVIAPAIPDGDWFALVSVGEDEIGEVTLAVDLAEMLSGQAARDAAVAAGVISEGEDLPNDFFIHNPEPVVEVAYLDDQADITVLSGEDVGKDLVIDANQLAALYQGEYVGPPVYGIIAGQPIAMELTIRHGLVTRAGAVYLP